MWWVGGCSGCCTIFESLWQDVSPIFNFYFNHCGPWKKDYQSICKVKFVRCISTKATFGPKKYNFLKVKYFSIKVIHVIVAFLVDLKYFQTMYYLSWTPLTTSCETIQMEFWSFFLALRYRKCIALPWKNLDFFQIYISLFWS